MVRLEDLRDGPLALTGFHDPSNRRKKKMARGIFRMYSVYVLRKCIFTDHCYGICIAANNGTKLDNCSVVWTNPDCVCSWILLTVVMKNVKLRFF